MRVLLDENIPEQIIPDFVGHECAHVIPIGWSGTKNGALIAKAEQAGFNVIVTYDSSMPSQNDISSKNLALVILKPKEQGVQATRALMGEVLIALTTCKPGDVLTFSNRIIKP